MTHSNQARAHNIIDEWHETTKAAAGDCVGYSENEWQELETLIAKALAKAAPDDYDAVLEDYRRLVRELDRWMNGEHAAGQASLCDLVSQFSRWKASPAPAWSSEKPKVDGYYWLRTMLMNDAGFERGSIMVRVGGKNGVIEHGGQFSSYTLESMEGEWSPIIQPPQEWGDS